VEARTADLAKGRPASAPGRAAALLGWGSAYTLYFVAFTSTIRFTYGFDLVKSLLGGFANTLPDALAAPLVLRVLAMEEPSGKGTARGPVSPLRLALLAAGFVVWSVAGTVFGLGAVRAWDTGLWRFPIDSKNLAWRALFSLLVFGALAGVGLARFHSSRAREASERAFRSEALRAEARLSILRAQLNPHFILNVLHSLVGLARRDPDATSSALERLGTTLRYALRVQNRRCDSVTLRDELAFTLEYLGLERLRLGERLCVRVRAQESALDRAVPPFVLQPLVENAVLHSISARARGGVVSIGIGNEGAVLLVTVDDDGTPAPAAAPPRRPGSGLGLKLLRDRLDAHYEGRGTLDVGPSPLGGTRARLRLEGEPAGAGAGDGEGE
jgi:hypothetical protein